MITFVTDQKVGEPCILKGNEGKPLIVKSIDGQVLLVLAPVEPWTHEELVSTQIEVFIGEEAMQGGVSAYLGDQFVGSTEV